MIDPNVLEGYILVDLTDPGNRPAGAVYVARPDDVPKTIAQHEVQEALRLST